MTTDKTPEKIESLAKPTRSKAMAAFCHQCMGYFRDGKADCLCTSCPLYPWYAFRTLEPDTSWSRFNPRRVGLVTWDDCKREYDEAQLDSMRERLALARDRTDALKADVAGRWQEEETRDLRARFAAKAGAAPFDGQDDDDAFRPVDSTGEPEPDCTFHVDDTAQDAFADDDDPFAVADPFETR